MAYVRHPRTTNERRADDGSDLIRAKRRQSNIPNEWNDKPQGRRGRSWKNNRKAQYVR